MGTPSAVGINNDLATREACEFARRLYARIARWLYLAHRSVNPGMVPTSGPE